MCNAQHLAEADLGCVFQRGKIGSVEPVSHGGPSSRTCAAPWPVRLLAGARDAWRALTCDAQLVRQLGTVVLRGRRAFRSLAASSISSAVGRSCSSSRTGAPM